MLLKLSITVNDKSSQFYDLQIPSMKDNCYKNRSPAVHNKKQDVSI